MGDAHSESRKRIELIKQLLEERQELSTKDIMREFGISQDTARRDIVLLTKREK